MLDKIRKVPEKVAFVIGLTLVGVSPLLLFLISEWLLLKTWIATIILVIIYVIATLFLLSAADKRQSRLGKGK